MIIVANCYIISCTNQNHVTKHKEKEKIIEVLDTLFTRLHILVYVLLLFAMQ